MRGDESFVALAQAMGSDPRSLMHSLLSQHARVLESWQSADLVSDDAALLRMALIHVQNAVSCMATLMRPCADCFGLPACTCGKLRDPSCPVHRVRLEDVDDNPPSLEATLREREADEPKGESSSTREAARGEGEPPAAGNGAEPPGGRDATGNPARKPYAPPTLTHLGSVSELTRGGGGSVSDGIANGSQPHRPGPR